MLPVRKVAPGAALVALLIGTAGCGSDSDQNGKNEGSGPSSDAFNAVQAAAERTQEVTSAGFTMNVQMPVAAGGDTQLEGVMSWDSEVAMDVMMTADALAEDPSAPDEMRIVWLDNSMFMDVGEEMAEDDEDLEGRNWLKMDLVAIAEELGDDASASALSFGLDDTSQDPGQQLGLLLESPEIELAGEETLDGATVNRYTGTITMEEALETGGGADMLTEEERQELVDMMRDQGIESYDMEVWVDENDYPVRINQSYDSNEGPVETETTFSDYGAEVSVEEPPADSVVDFLEMLLETEEEGLEESEGLPMEP